MRKHDATSAALQNNQYLEQGKKKKKKIHKLPPLLFILNLSYCCNNMPL